MSTSNVLLLKYRDVLVLLFKLPVLQIVYILCVLIDFVLSSIKLLRFMGYKL